MKSITTLLLLAALFVIAGCATTDNNYLRPADFARQLKRDGLPVGEIKPLHPLPLGATDALEVKVGNSNIGVYKYDRSVSIMRKRLDVIRKNKRVYFNCIPYPVYEVHGSFVVVGLDKNSYKHQILESLRNFK